MDRARLVLKLPRPDVTPPRARPEQSVADMFPVVRSAPAATPRPGQPLFAPSPVAARVSHLCATSPAYRYGDAQTGLPLRQSAPGPWCRPRARRTSLAWRGHGGTLGVHLVLHPRRRCRRPLGCPLSGTLNLADRCTVSALESVLTLRSQSLYELSMTLYSTSPPGASSMVWAASADSLPADNRLCMSRSESDHHHPHHHHHHRHHSYHYHHQW
jgi:hypothetical protein